MGTGTDSNIILIGFSTTGKSTAGKIVARDLGWDLVDIDNEIEQAFAKPIPDIFAQDGEEKFRAKEIEILNHACQREHVVIACGGGAIVNSANRELVQSSGIVVLLEANVSTIYQRLKADTQDADKPVVRPLLQCEDPLQRIRLLKEQRQLLYDSVADWIVHTDYLTTVEVAREVIRGWNYGKRRFSCTTKQAELSSNTVITSTGSYPIYVGNGLLNTLGDKLKKAGISGNVNIVSDNNVFPIYGSKVMQNLHEARYKVDFYIIPAGEQSKSFETAVKIYDWLLGKKAERGDAVIAMGGGVVGDLAGYVAATYLRGIPLIHVPTSLLAMVDASIGGKVAVDLKQGKNLIGSFYQPRFVLTDVETLNSLPHRELTSGWAELIKHALIRDKDLFKFLSDNCQDLIRLNSSLTLEAVERSTAIKAVVVTIDEKETGLRTILNYGHTIAHALETATGYDRFLHGEAVSIGMAGAAMISKQMGLIDQSVVDRQNSILQKFGLPISCAGVDKNAVLEAMTLDKKVSNKKIRWVLLNGIGNVVIRNDIPQEIVKEVVSRLITG